MQINKDILLREYAKKMGATRTFQMRDNRFWAGGMSFATPQEAHSFREGFGMKSYAEIVHGRELYLQDRVGPSFYAGLDGMLNRMVEESAKQPGGVDLTNATLERYAFEHRKGRTQNLIDRFGSHGLLLPYDDQNILLRLKDASGNYIPTDQLADLFRNVFGMDPGAGYDDIAKLLKRIKNVVNAEETGFYLPAGRTLRAHLFDTSDSQDQVVRSMLRGLDETQLKHGFDGLAVANGNILYELANEQEKVAKGLSANAKRILADASQIHLHGQAATDIADSTTMMERIAKLRKMAKEGGSAEAFRALGLKDIDGNEIANMIKGDVWFAPAKRFIAGLKRYGFTEKEAGMIDILASKESAPKQLYSKIGAGTRASYLTMRIHDLDPSDVRLDLQSLTSFGGGNIWDAHTLARENVEQYSEMVGKFVKTGEIDKGFVRMLREQAAQTEVRKGQTILKMDEEVRRAKMLLGHIDSGMPPTPEIASQILEGMRRATIHNKYPGAPNFKLQDVIQGHVKNYETYKNFVNPKYELQPGSLGYRSGYGWVMHENDVASMHKIHGTFDLDDLLRQHLRWDTQDNAFKVIGIRSPNTMGEIGFLNFDLHDNYDFLRELVKDRAPEAEVKELLRQRRFHLMSDRALDLQTALDATGGRDPQLRARLERLSNALSQRMVEAENFLTPEQIRSRLEQIGRGYAPDLTPQQLEYLKPLGKTAEGYDEIRKSANRTVAFDNDKARSKWMTRRGLTDEDLLKGFEGADIDSLVSKNVTGLERALQRQSFLYERAHGLGGIGRYVNVDMLVNAIDDQLVGDAAHSIPFFDSSVSDIVDKFIQGGNAQDFEQAARQINAMLYGIGEAVTQHGVKLPRQFVMERGFLENKSLHEAIERADPNFFTSGKTIDDILTDDTPFDRFYSAYRDVRTVEDSITSQAKLAFKQASPINDFYFSTAETTEAERIYEVFKATRDYHTDMIKAYVPTEGWEAESFADLSSFIAKDEGARAIQREMFHYTDDAGRLTDEGIRIYGALLQTKRGKIAQALHQNSLGELTTFVEEHFHHKKGFGDELRRLAGEAPTQKEADALIKGADDLDARMVAGLNMSEAMRLDPGGEPLLEGALSGINKTYQTIKAAGAKRAGRMKASYNTAKGVTEPLYERFSMKTFKELAENPLARKAGLAALGATAFSFIWQKFRDRSPEDAKGPPLLPGGSAYESMPSYPLYPEGTLSQASQGGITYNVTAHGDFNPQELQSSIEGITGGSVSGSYYNSHSSRISRPRMSRRRNNDEMFGG